MNGNIAGDSRMLRIGTALAVLTVAGVAAMVSFIHISHLALTHGQGQLSALLLPVSIDGDVAASSLVMLRSARLDLDTPKLARSMLVLGVLATLGANLAYGIGFGVIGACLSAWPAVAFIGCTEMAIGMVRARRATVATEHTPSRARLWLSDQLRTVRGWFGDSDPADASESVPEHTDTEASQTVDEDTQRPAQDQPEAPLLERPARARKRGSSSEPKTPAERAHDLYSERILSGSPVPSLRTVMADLNLGQPRAREARAHLESLVPAFVRTNGNAAEVIALPRCLRTTTSTRR